MRPKQQTSSSVTIRRLLVCSVCGLMMGAVLFRFASVFRFLEYDELFTAITVHPTVSFWWIIKNYLIIDVHPPLFNYLLWLWNHAGPWTSEIYMHSFSLLCSLLAVGIGWYCFPKRLGRTTRFVFIGLLVCSLADIKFAGQARSYSLLLFCCVVLTFSALEVWYCLQKNKPLSWRNYGVFCISGLLAGYTHYFGLATFCAFALFLLGAASYFRRCVWKMAFGYAGVFLLCLCWLIPNVLQNIYQGRFSGNWWAGQESSFSGFLIDFYRFLFANSVTCACVLMIVNLGLFGWWFFHRHQVKYQRFNGEIICLLAAILLVFAAVGLVSMKAFMFVPRFFFALFPAFFLLEALLLTPWIRRHNWVLLVFVCYLGYNLYMYLPQVKQAADSWGAKSFAQYFMSQSDKKELFVLAHYGVPPVALQPMMSWYLNVYYKQPTPVTVLTTLSENDFNEALKRRGDAIIWVPLCPQSFRIKALSEKIGRKIYITQWIDSSCEVTL